MKLELDALELGALVYVNLGFITVKHGKVVGQRITVDHNNKPSIEYNVYWFGAGDRPSETEWFPSRQVHITPDAAFKS